MSTNPEILNRAAATGRAVVKVVRGRPASDGAGVKLTRVIGSPSLPDLDPFLMLDEFRSDDAADYMAGFPDHPHRGFETVTYMLAGRMRHGDHKGNVGLLRPGSVQWMTAGRGIVHSEMPEQENGLMWGFQLWVNLPAKDKMIEPRYQDIAPEAIPETTRRRRARARDRRPRRRRRRAGARRRDRAGLSRRRADAERGVRARRCPPAMPRSPMCSRARPRSAAQRIARGELAVLGEGDVVRLKAGAEAGRADPCRRPAAAASRWRSTGRSS